MALPALSGRPGVCRSGVRIRPEGRGEIRHQDALELLAGLEPGSAGAMVMDPPLINGDMAAAGYWNPDVPSPMDEVIAWSVPVAERVFRALRPGGASIVMGSSQSIAAWEVAAAKVGLEWMAELVILWNSGKPRTRKFGSLTTIVRWHAKPGCRHSFNADARSVYSNVLVCSRVPTAERVHPTQKPVELTNFFISLLTREDDLVVDPYCGSGSTLVSAAMCGRPWLGCDNDLEACRTAEVRTKRLELEEANLQPLYLWINNRLVPVEG